MVTLASLAFTETVFPASDPVPTIVAEPAHLVVLVVNVAAAGPAITSRLPPPMTATATSRAAQRRLSPHLGNRTRGARTRGASFDRIRTPLLGSTVPAEPAVPAVQAVPLDRVTKPRRGVSAE